MLHELTLSASLLPFTTRLGIAQKFFFLGWIHLDLP